MYAWEHGFDLQEIQAWMDRNQQRYRQDGFGFFAVIRKQDHQLIGVAGPLLEYPNGCAEMGIAYIIGRRYWHQGYGLEAAKASLVCAFQAKNITKVIAEIRPENVASCGVAKRLGMNVEGQFIKRYRGKEMPHLIYAIERKEWEQSLIK